MDVEDRKHLHRLYQHLASSRRRLEVFRSNRVKALREYVGRNYSEDGTSDHVMLNLIQQAVRIYSSLLASQNPKAAVYTKYRQLKPSAKNMSLALDHLIEEVDFETTLRQVVHDALFSYGVVVTGVCDYRQVEIDGYTHDYGQPYADYVEAEDYVLDMRAKREDQCRFKGHRYRMLYEDARNHADFDPEAKELLTPTSRFLHNEQGDDRAETISRGNAFDLDDTEDYVELWDLWLPRENVIVTLAAGDDGNSEANSPPLRIRPWTGPERGPYHMLGFIYVPGQLLPAAPVQHWIEIHQLVNRLSNKLGGQADRQKTFTAGSRSGAEDADRVVKTVDGGCYTFDDPDKIKEVSTGGIDPRTMGYVLQLKDWFNTSAGNLEVLGGLGSQADTATQEQLLAGSAARPVADMQAAVHKFTRRVLKTWAHLLWYDPLIQIPLVKRIPGTTLDVYSTWPYQMLPDGREVDLREGDFLDYNFDIQPYSTEQQTPAAQLQKLRTLVNEFLLPLMPIMQQQGTIPDAAALLRAYARYTNMHDLEELMIFLQAPSQEQPVQPLHQSPITRRENVRINKPGATRQGHDQTMIQLLMGGRPQGAEMAGLARGAM